MFENARRAAAIEPARLDEDSLVSPPCAPAFIRSAPPIVPGTPRRKARPSIPASAAARATCESSAAAPAIDAIVRGRLDRAERLAAEANHHAAHAAVAHDEIGADADRR